MHKYWIIFGLIIANILLLGSCRDTPTEVSGPFPVAGAELTLAQTENLVFQWDTLSATAGKGEDVELSDPIFRIYRYKPQTSQRSTKEQFVFDVVDEQILTTGKTSLAAKDNALKLREGAYAWEVVRYDETGDQVEQQALTYFAVGPGNTSSLRDLRGLLQPDEQSFCVQCDRLPPQCQLTCYPISCPTNTHIATFEGFNFALLRGNISSGNGNNSYQGIACFEPSLDDSIYVDADFKVLVPKDSITKVLPTSIQPLLFEGDSLIAPVHYRWSFALNGSAGQKVLNIAQPDYLPACYSLRSDSLIYQAQLNLTSAFKYKASKNYTYVFYIPEDQNHAHGWTTLHDAMAHNYSGAASRQAASCAFPTTRLDYYQCLEASGTHAADHVVIVPLNICPQ